MDIKLNGRTVGIYANNSMSRSVGVANAMATGLSAITGQRAPVLNAVTHTDKPDVAVFYGLHGNLKKRFDEYCADPSRDVVYIDLGYWSRRTPSKKTGYHKVSVNTRHPLSYFQRRKHPRDRFDVHAAEVTLREYKPGAGQYIVLAGMGPKACAFYNLQPESWERRAIEKIRQHTDMRVVYRPKPNYQQARRLPDCEFWHRDGKRSSEVLRKAYAVVSHHSNVCVNAVAMGVPVFCVDGIALAAGHNFDTDAKALLNPRTDIDRLQFLSDVAYLQWNVQEMASGAVWRYLLDEGLI